MPVDHPQGQKAIRMVRAGTFESPAVSKQQQWAPGLSSHSLPPLCRYRQRTVHCSRHRNQEMSCKSFGETEEESGGKNIRQQNKKKKGKRNKGSNKNARSNLRTDGLGNTDADLRSADNQCPFGTQQESGIGPPDVHWPVSQLGTQGGSTGPRQAPTPPPLAGRSPSTGRLDTKTRHIRLSNLCLRVATTASQPL